MSLSNRSRRIPRMLVAVLAVLLLTPAASLWGQNAQGTIVGHVTDPSGAAVSGASVTVTDLSTSVTRHLTTNSSGDYTVPYLNPGTYSVTVQAHGFSQATASNLVLEVQQTLRQDFALQVGNVSQTVTVSATTQMLHTDDTTIGQVLQEKTIENLPIVGRDFTNLMVTNVGTTVELGGDEADWSYHGINNEYLSVSSDGTQAQNQSYSIDGINDTDYEFSTPINIPNELAIQEFKMMNGMYGAEYGPGAVQVNVSINSGTNRLHGAAYEALEANWMQPDNEFQATVNNDHLCSVTNNCPSGDTYTPGFTPSALSLPFHQNQFGGTLGGPLIIPHVYDGRNKTFWFGSYDEGLYSAVNSPSSVFAPTPAELSGDFSSWPFPIYDPSTTTPNPSYNPTGTLGPTNSPVIRTQFPNNQIPVLDPVAQKIGAYFGKPNNSGCDETAHLLTGCGNYTVDTSTTKKQGIGTARIDQYLGPNDHLFFTANVGNLSQVATSISFGQSGTTYDRPKLFGGTWTHTFSADTLNQATLGYSRDHFLTGVTTAYGPDLSALVGLANTAPNPVTYDLPNVCFSPSIYYCIGGGEPTTYADNIYQGVDTVTMVRGRHTLNWGIDVRRIQLFELDNYLGTGSVGFNGEFTALVPGFAGSPYTQGGAYTATAPYQGNPVADFDLGDTNSATGPPPIGTDDYLLWGTNWNLFVNDDFHATNKLTINAGLRWMRPPNFHSAHNDGFAFNQANGGQYVWANCNFTKSIIAGINAMTPPGTPNMNFLQCGAINTLVPIDKRDFAPRLGFALQAMPKFVVRGGFGIFYGLYNRYYDGTQYDKDSIYNETAATYPSPAGTETQSTAVLKNLWAPPISADQLFETPGWEFPYNQTNWPKNRNPYDLQWMLDTEYSMNQTLMLDVGYVGDHGLHQPSQDIIGAARPPSVANDTCNSLVDASQATGSDAYCLSDPNFQPMDTREPFPNMPPYFYANINGFGSWYNALQVQLIERNYHGFMLHGNYTYSKTMDVTSGVNNLYGEPSLIQDPQNPYQEYGLAASDETHRFVATYVYTVPDHLFASHWLNAVASGWTTSGIYQLGSGLPFSVGASVPADQMGEYYGGRYNANSTFQTKPGFKSSLSEYFDTSKYSNPALGRYGNTNKSPERTPYIENLDANLGKTTHLGEGISLLIRADVFNYGSNWHSPTALYGSKIFPASNIGNGNFGSLIPGGDAQYGNISLWSPHVLQLTGQITF